MTDIRKATTCLGYALLSASPRANHKRWNSKPRLTKPSLNLCWTLPTRRALKTAMKAPVIFDGRNLYEPQAMQSSGMEYVAIGRGKHV